MKRKELTFKQRVKRRHKTAYCARHADMPDLWCVFLRRDDTSAKVCAFKINDAWREAATCVFVDGRGLKCMRPVGHKGAHKV